MPVPALLAGAARAVVWDQLAQVVIREALKGRKVDVHYRTVPFDEGQRLYRQAVARGAKVIEVGRYYDVGEVHTPEEYAHWQQEAQRKGGTLLHDPLPPGWQTRAQLAETEARYAETYTVAREQISARWAHRPWRQR